MDENQDDDVDGGASVTDATESLDNVDGWEEWDPDQDSLADMDRVMTAVAVEMSHGPCRCCGVLISDLVEVDEDRPPTTKAEAIMKARAFFEAALWNAQIVRRAIPTRKELAAALAAVQRLAKLLKGDDEAFEKATGAGREYPAGASEEELQRWQLDGWCRPYAFFTNRRYFDAQAERVERAGSEFVAAVEELLTGVDGEIAFHMFDPPTDVGRPRTSFVERYAYRYLAESGFRPAEIEDAVGDLARRLREVEDRIGLKKLGKSANPRSLLSTIRRCSTRQ